MYSLKLNNNFATILEDKKAIEPLCNLFMANQSEVNQLGKMVKMANNAAALQSELKTKERDTEHLLELGNKLAALTAERDRLREALGGLAYYVEALGGYEKNSLLGIAMQKARAALDKDA